MDLRTIRHDVAGILHLARDARHNAHPAIRDNSGRIAVDRLLSLLAMLDAHIDALPAAAAAATQARTACREHLYPRAQPCVHDDDGQEEQGMGEASAVPAPWKSPD